MAENQAPTTAEEVKEVAVEKRLKLKKLLLQKQQK
jgi:hypothetical protein